MLKFGVLFEVRTEFLNITQTSFDLKELKYKYCYVNFYSTVASTLKKVCTKLLEAYWLMN
jgi:hypothetical protein